MAGQMQRKCIWRCRNNRFASVVTDRQWMKRTLPLGPRASSPRLMAVRNPKAAGMVAVPVRQLFFILGALLRNSP
jgi:hypothetical protein